MVLVLGLVVQSFAFCKQHTSTTPFVEGEWQEFRGEDTCWKKLHKCKDVLHLERPLIDGADNTIESLRDQEHRVALDVVRFERRGGRYQKQQIYGCYVRERVCTTLTELEREFTNIHKDEDYLKKHSFWLAGERWFQAFTQHRTSLISNNNNRNKTTVDNATVVESANSCSGGWWPWC